MSLRYLPLDRLPPLCAEDLRHAAASGTWTEIPGTTRRSFRYAPEFIDDPAATGLLAGTGPEVYAAPPVFAAALNQARLVGYRTTISDGGFRSDEILPGPEAEAAYLDRLASPDPFANEETGLRRGPDGGFTPDPGRSEQHVPGTTVVLCSQEPGNYGSFLFRVLPKLQTVAALGLGDLNVFTWAWPPPFQRLLQLAGLDPARLLQHDPARVVRFDRAIVPGLRNPHAYLDTASHQLMQAMADRCAGEGSGRRIYVSRLRHGRVEGSTRVMLNEDALVARLAALDFDVIEPEQLSIDAQIAAFAGADLVVGPAGSAMFNTVFCRPGTKVVDIESEPHWIYAHAGLFASCQLRYGLFVGRADPSDARPVHRRWTVDIEALMDRLATFIAA